PYAFEFTTQSSALRQLVGARVAGPVEIERKRTHLRREFPRDLVALQLAAVVAATGRGDIERHVMAFDDDIGQREASEFLRGNRERTGDVAFLRFCQIDLQRHLASW